MTESSIIDRTNSNPFSFCQWNQALHELEGTEPLKMRSFLLELTQEGEIQNLFQASLKLEREIVCCIHEKKIFKAKELVDRLQTLCYWHNYPAIKAVASIAYVNFYLTRAANCYSDPSCFAESMEKAQDGIHAAAKALCQLPELGGFLQGKFCLASGKFNSFKNDFTAAMGEYQHAELQFKKYGFHYPAAEAKICSLMVNFQSNLAKGVDFDDIQRTFDEYPLLRNRFLQLKI